jgi:WD40 repeat protein
MHTDMITDMLVIDDEGLLATSGLDKLIHLWDLPSTHSHLDDEGDDDEGAVSKSSRNVLSWRAARLGHFKGVSCLAFGGAHVLVSAGYDFDIIAWDLLGVATRPLFRLIGHRHPLVSVVMIPGMEQCVSVDQGGHFRWWDIRRNSSIEEADRCLQTFTSSTLDLSGFKPFSITTLGLSTSAILAGGARLRLFTLEQVKRSDQPSVNALYSVADMTMVTTAGKDVKVWDAKLGTVLRVYHGVTRTNISQISFDQQQRKLIIADQAGNLSVHNYLNGSLMYKLLPPQTDEVTCLRYWDEDRCIVTAGWDRSLRVYDDYKTHDMLRVVENAHTSDITCLAKSEPLSLIATGSADGTIRFWDFSFFSLEASCQTASSISCMAFVEPYPLLVTANMEGMMCVWPVRPWTDAVTPLRNLAPYTCVYTFPNRIFDPEHSESDSEGFIVSSVTSLVSVYDHEGGAPIATAAPVATATTTDAGEVTGEATAAAATIGTD